MKKNLDNITGSGLFMAQAVSKRRVHRRTRTDFAVFLRPQYERTVGWGWTYNTLRGKSIRRTYARFRATRQLSKAVISNKHRSNTMHDFTRPVDVIDECAYKIAFLSDFFSQPLDPKGEPYLSSDGCQGLYLLLSEIKDTINQATSVIVEQRRIHKEGLQ